MTRPINYTHESYTLRKRLTKVSNNYATDTEAQRIGFELEPVDGNRIEAISYENRIVYVIRHGREIIYVGEGFTNIKDKIDRGFSPRRYFERTGAARNGYKGYKWIDLLLTDEPPILKVDVFMFDANLNGDHLRQVIEGIEGELVYKVRNDTGKWPEYQNEIHFSNQEGAGETAESIYEAVAK